MSNRDLNEIARRLSKGVDDSFMRDEEKLRALIRRVSSEVNTPIDRNTMNELIRNIMNSTPEDLKNRLR
jgi:type IV secretory pathway VirD2 relaxase